MKFEPTSSNIQEKNFSGQAQLKINITNESDPNKAEQIKNEVIIRFDPEDSGFGLIVQKFVLLKNDKGYIFGTIPKSEAREHLEMAKIIAQEKGLEEDKYEKEGGGFLNYDVRENTIRFDTMAKSLKMGPIKISWEKLLEIVKEGTKSNYKIELDEY